MVDTVAYQGTRGAYSHLACCHVFPAAEALACDDFHAALAMVEDGQADRAMIPLENSTAGRVEEIYRLLPNTSLSIIAEHFEPVNHCLLPRRGRVLRIFVRSLLIRKHWHNVSNDCAIWACKRWLQSILLFQLAS